MYDKRNNIYIDLGDKYIQTPSGRDVRVAADPVDFTTKLNEIDKPFDRLCIFLNSTFNPTCTDATLEASFVRMIAAAGLIGGFTYGANFHTGNIRERFIRKHNAAAFDSQHLAQRKYYDYMVTRVASRAGKYAIQGLLLSGGAALVASASIVYRDRIYAPDWFVGYGTMGVLSRFWLGPKAWVFGGGMGLVVATFALGFAKGLEWLSGMDTAQMRYLNHTEWKHRRLFEYERIRLNVAKAHQDKFEKLEDGDDIMD